MWTDSDPNKSRNQTVQLGLCFFGYFLVPVMTVMSWSSAQSVGIYNMAMVQYHVVM